MESMKVHSRTRYNMPFYKALGLQFRFAKAARVKKAIEEAACAVQISQLQREIRVKRMRLQEIRAQKRVLSDDVRRQVTEFRDRISEALSNILETIWQDTTCPDANILSALPPINPKDTLHSRDSSTHPSVSQAESSNIKNHCCKVLGPIVGREEIIVSNDIVPESESSRPAYGDQSSVTELEGYHSDLVVDTFTKVEKLLADGSGKVGNTV